VGVKMPQQELSKAHDKPAMAWRVHGNTAGWRALLILDLALMLSFSISRILSSLAAITTASSSFFSRNSS
jgi:hypothetical protein